MPSKTKAETNKQFFQKKKDETHICPDCNEPVKYQSRVKHLTSKKHLENMKKTRRDFMDEYLAVHAKLAAPKANLTEIFREMFYLIQTEYFDSDGCELPTDEEKWIQPKTNNDGERQFCENTAYVMREVLQDTFDKKIINAYGVEELNEWEGVEMRFHAVNTEAKDAKTNYLRFFRGLMEPPKPRVVQEAMVVADDGDKSDDTEEEEQEDEQEDAQEEEEEEEDGVDAFVVDETSYITSHFPSIYDFRRLTKLRKAHVLEEIGSNCADVFDDERYLVDRIYSALSENDNLQYIILYDDVYTCYKRFQYSLTVMMDEEQEMMMEHTTVDEGAYNYDFNY
jgi:hypothetical protein